ncbi:MAG: TiaS agmantine-binding domain-containing protein [Thermoprotei archaeon]|jgi:tRNA(Ile2)-agmatinylcytidine synthase
MCILPVWIGIDDTDSYSGGCTTWFAAKLAMKFKDRLMDFPYLVRLNPEIPWKTRGNGALAIKLASLSQEEAQEAAEFVLSGAREEGKTNPSFLVVWGDPQEQRFAMKAITDIITRAELQAALNRLRPISKYFLKREKKMRGLIGCIAAVSHAWSDYTYELIAYRDDQSYDRPEYTDDVLWMDSLTAPITFLNFDRETGKPLIYPHGPDPVLYGIRGEDPIVLKASAKILRNTSSFSMIFRTNQGTDEHIVKIDSFREAYPYTTVSMEAHVLSGPNIIMGGHVVLDLMDKHGNWGQVIFYRQSGNLNRAARKLRKNDLIQVWGGVRPEAGIKVINAQGFKLIAADTTSHEVPLCPFCHRKMREVNQDRYYCNICGVYAQGKATSQIKRDLLLMRAYQPSSSGFKHLMKPGGRRRVPIAHEIRASLT